MKEVCIRTPRALLPFEANHLDRILRKNAIILNVYEELGNSNWNFIEIEDKAGKSYFVSMPKIEGSCSPSIFGPAEHFYNFCTVLN
jgi:hypothetical protein